LTQWLAYIPSDQFETLNAYVKTPNSPLYAQSGIQGQLARQINTAFPLAASNTVPNPQASVDSSGSSSIPDLSRLLLPWWMVDLVRSTPHPSRMNEQCNDNKPVIRTTWQLNLRTTRTHPTIRLRDTGSRILLKTLDPSLAIHSMIWSLNPMSRLRLVVETWLGGVQYRSTKDKLVSLLYRAVHSSLGSTITSLIRIGHGHSLHSFALGSLRSSL
jgi:hypothetical protein